MRRILGWLSVVAALCVVSWAQLPGENSAPPPKYARAELFGGYAYGDTDLFNAGHRAGLQGWNASLSLNAASWLGFVIDGSGLYGTSKIPLAVPKPFPLCPQFCPPGTNTFNVKTTMYNYLFGLQFPYRKWDRWTPFGEVLFGHTGVRGESFGTVETGGGLGLAAGGGADYNINRRFAVRFKADYLQSRDFKQKQDNLRFSVGIVIRTIPRKKRTLEDITPVESTPPAQTSPESTAPPQSAPPAMTAPQETTTPPQTTSPESAPPPQAPPPQ